MKELTVVQSTSGTQWPIFPEIADGDVGELSFDIFDESSHD